MMEHSCISPNIAEKFYQIFTKFLRNFYEVFTKFLPNFFTMGFCKHSKNFSRGFPSTWIFSDGVFQALYFFTPTKKRIISPGPLIEDVGCKISSKRAADATIHKKSLMILKLRYWISSLEDYQSINSFMTKIKRLDRIRQQV